MLHPIKAYLNYLLCSKNQYGVHSPFLFDFITKGLRGQHDISLDRARLFRKELLENTLEIDVTDFGAGSKVFKTNKRSLADIAAKAGISNKRGELLAKTVAYFKPERILEIGSSLGISSAFMSSGSPKTHITTLEGCPATTGIAMKYFKKFHFSNIEIIVGEFEETIDLAITKRQFDLIYFDGNHQKEPTISYFEKCLNSAQENSIFIFDDIHWTPDMEEAWDHIRAHPKVTLSVDTFKWGLVFFHKERAKQHFTLRI